MANTTTSPNMNLPVPNVGVDPGTDWSTNINACMAAIDSHSHVSGQGVPVTPGGINITSDLTYGGNNAYALRSVRFTNQSAPIALAADIGCIYESGGDLYYNDSSGNQVRITQSGSVAGSTGTITGLPSGTASASFAGSTFTFQSATNTPATLSVGPIVTATSTASPHKITLSSPNALAADYAMTWPTALPGASSIFASDASGNMSFTGVTGTGSVVQAFSPTIVTPVFSGVPTGTITTGTYTPTVTAGATGTAQVGVANSFTYTRVGNQVTVFGELTGTSNGSGQLTTIVTLPIAPSSNFAASVSAIGVVGVFPSTNLVTGCGAVLAVAGTKTVQMQISTSAANAVSGQTVNFTYSCA